MSGEGDDRVDRSHSCLVCIGGRSGTCSAVVLTRHATAEDAVQEALIQAALPWPERQPGDPKGWLITVASRKLLDAHRCGSSRRDREQRVEVEPPPGPTKTADDTVQRRGRRPVAGLAALATVGPTLPRHTAASAYLNEKADDLLDRDTVDVDAARSAPTSPNVTTSPRQAAPINQALGP